MYELLRRPDNDRKASGRLGHVLNHQRGRLVGVVVSALGAHRLPQAMESQTQKTV